ncbi:HAD domain-containing protein [Nocardia sp. CC227C]|uniref:HAD domain-containing protein n=1 Tax=Nocardia sp. CC227C TaxID=3044562 RepID=UPI00278BB0F4|nr:HAD domain-containing protein [Nocardia sp. CC227C]
MASRPLLYLDVDGPLNPYAANPNRRPEGYETHRMLPPSWIAQREGMGRVKPLRVWLNPTHGPALLTLADRFDLVWATTWEHDANTYIGPNIGLPELPVVEWQTTERFGPDGTFFKTAELVEHAAGRPFVWVDDDITERDRRYVERHHPAAALLRFVDPAVGLDGDDFEAIGAFGASIAAAA